MISKAQRTVALWLMNLSQKEVFDIKEFYKVYDPEISYKYFILLLKLFEKAKIIRLEKTSLGFAKGTFLRCKIVKTDQLYEIAIGQKVLKDE
jgi:hypothetical protein